MKQKHESYWTPFKLKENSLRNIKAGNDTDYNCPYAAICASSSTCYLYQSTEGGENGFIHCTPQE